MGKPLTPRESIHRDCLGLMRKYHISWDKQRELIIWAAKHRQCPSCKAVPYEPCVNLLDLKKGVANLRKNKEPHDMRIDWVKLRKALKERFGE